MASVSFVFRNAVQNIFFRFMMGSKTTILYTHLRQNTKDLRAIDTKIVTQSILIVFCLL